MKLVYLEVCVIVAFIDASRILVYIPTPSISHQLPFRPLTQELARRGHEVIVITADPAFPKGETPVNLTEIDIHDLSYSTFKRAFLDQVKGKKDDFIDNLESTFDFFMSVIDKQLNSSAVKEIYQGEQSFDLLIFEACNRPILALSHVLKAPVILASSLGPIFGSKEIIGAPVHPLLYPTALRQRLNNLTIWEKLKELYNYYRMERIMYKHETVENEMLQKHFGNDLPSLSELYNNVDMLFLNIHPIFEGNHPVPPGVVYMWGIHKKSPKPLPMELKSYLDSSKHGVIYMSFGTNTDPTKLPPSTIEKFVKVFCELPYDVLWKWDGDELPGRCSNIRIGKWFPQSDLLRHPNIKLFVTQGGLQSTDEAITAGVPLVGIPMLGDQWYNVEKYEEFKIGVQLDALTFTQEDFKNAVTNVINDESFRNNIKKLDELMGDEPMPPLERAVWWTEYVLRHGGARHLRAPAANISWAHYLELEFFFTLLVGLIVIISLSFVLILKVYQIILNQFVTQKKLKVK